MLEKLTKTEFLLGVLNSVLISALTALSPKLGLSEGMLLTAASLLGVSTVGYGAQRTWVKVKSPDIVPPIDPAKIPTK